MEILWSLMGGIRQIFAWIDTIAFGLIDNAYELIMKFASTEIFQADLIRDVRNNVYVIIGIFALFRLALLLVNAMINPDKLTEKGSGIGNVLVNLFITFILLIATPIIFNEAMFLQCMVIGSETKTCTRPDGTLVNTEGHFIEQIFLGSNSNSNNNISNNDAGAMMRSIAISSLITLSEECQKESVNCGAAEDAYIDMEKQDNFTMPKIAKYIDEKHKGEWVYNYNAIITFVAGIAITYVLFSFAIDVAVRTFELVTLQMFAPLFIVTYIDPKSAKSGAFKNWVKACGKTYVSLFIKIAILAVMMLTLKLINNLNWEGLANFTLLIGLLIFAKKAPKWICEIIGVDGGIGELGIGKKLGGAALVGGAISKGIGAAKNFGQQKAKNFMANRVRNTAARGGAMKEAYQKNRENARNGVQDRQSVWRQGRAAAKQSMYDNWGKDSKGVIDAAKTGYMAGRLKVNDEAKSISEKMKIRVGQKAEDYDNKIGNTPEKIKKAQEIAKNMKEAEKVYKNVSVDKSTGDRLKITVDGKQVYVHPVGTKEMNAAFNNPVSEHDAYKAYGKNLAQSKGYTVDSSGQVIDSSGKVINKSVADYGQENMSYAGKLAIKSLVAENVKSDVSRYQSSMQSLQAVSASYTQGVNAYNNVIKEFNSNPEIQKASTNITEYEKLESSREASRSRIIELKNNSDYVQLSSREYSTLTSSEQNRLASYNLEIKNNVNAVNSINTELKSKEANYNASVELIKTSKEKAGILTMEQNIAQSKKQVDAWAEEVKQLEDKFKTAEVFVYDDYGKLEVDPSTGNYKTKNPYVVELDSGEKVNPVENYIRIDEINIALSNKAQKAKKKYDEEVKDKTSSDK